MAEPLEQEPLTARRVLRLVMVLSMWRAISHGRAVAGQQMRDAVASPGGWLAVVRAFVRPAIETRF